MLPHQIGNRWLEWDPNSPNSLNDNYFTYISNFIQDLGIEI